MDEDEDRGIGAASAINIELLYLGGPIRCTLWRSYASAHGIAVARETL